MGTLLNKISKQVQIGIRGNVEELSKGEFTFYLELYWVGRDDLTRRFFDSQPFRSHGLAMLAMETLAAGAIEVIKKEVPVAKVIDYGNHGHGNA